MTHHTRWRGIARAIGYSSADCRWFARRVRFWVENEVGSNNTTANQYATMGVIKRKFPHIGIR